MKQLPLQKRLRCPEGSSVATVPLIPTQWCGTEGNPLPEWELLLFYRSSFYCAETCRVSRSLRNTCKLPICRCPSGAVADGSCKSFATSVQSTAIPAGQWSTAGWSGPVNINHSNDHRGESKLPPFTQTEADKIIKCEPKNWLFHL